MQALTDKGRKVFIKLLRLAGGNCELVYKALRKYGSGDNVATMDQLISYIEEHR